MDLSIIASTIIRLRDKDLSFRDKLIAQGQLGNGYHPDMEALHVDNAERLKVIIDEIGYPTPKKVGDEASKAAWLIVQHAISKPDFMRHCLQLLESEEEADPREVAYLSDRIAVLSGRPQLYGTQYDWDEHGHLSPNSYDDILSVNERRKLLGLNSLEEQTTIMRSRAIQENETPPEDYNKRLHLMNEWKKRVGWIE